MKILTVDDSRMIRSLIRRCLSSLPLEIVEAENGQAGLEKAASERPDLVILDVNMPVMDGMEMLRAMRSQAGTKGIKVLIVTAESAEKIALELIKLGISDYIVKPFEEETLFRKVCKILLLDPTSVDSRGANGGLKKVLVVDDNESVLLVSRKFLAGVADVVTTSNPERALQLASQHNPEVVVLDLQTEALGVLREMKEDPSLSSSRFVCLTTRSMSDQIGDVQEAGFAEVLFKPFDKETLTKVVVG